MPRTQSKPARILDAYDCPEYQASKAARRNISHHDAVQESAFLQKQFRDMWSSEMAQSPVDLNEVIRTLTKKKIPFVLTGAHSIGGWTGRPRNTHDVDVLVKQGRNHARAVKAMRELYPDLEVRVFNNVTAFFVPGGTQSVLDVAFPLRADNAASLAEGIWLERDGLRYRIPPLENALANKYGAMLATDRDPGKRLLDAVDFSFMVRHSFDPAQQPLDLSNLRRLGELVWPGGGGDEIVALVDEAKSTGMVDLVALIKRDRQP